jgi:CheY-like chemotaxis protein
VLIVDDHAPFRVLPRAPLQLEGFEIVSETAGRRALVVQALEQAFQPKWCSSLPAVSSSDQPITPP